MSNKYTYSVSTDFPQQKVATDALKSQIRSSAITTAVNFVSVSNDVCSVWFKSVLSPTEETTLNGLIAAHDGTPLTTPPAVVEIAGNNPETDGRMRVVNSPMTKSMMAWWTGAGDIRNPTLPSSGRGEGQKLYMKFDGPGTQTVELEFSSYVEIFDGEANWTPSTGWSTLDRWNAYIVVDDNAPHLTETPETGNCNRVDTGSGFDLVVPAAGDGQYTIDLDEAKPIPAPKGSGMGWWKIDDFIDGSIDIDPSLDGTAKYALCAGVKFHIYFCKNMPMGSPLGVFLVDSDKSEPIHKNWKLGFDVQKLSDRPGEMGGWFKFFRPATDEIIF